MMNYYPTTQIGADISAATCHNGTALRPNALNPGTPTLYQPSSSRMKTRDTHYLPHRQISRRKTGTPTIYPAVEFRREVSVNSLGQRIRTGKDAASGRSPGKRNWNGHSPDMDVQTTMQYTAMTTLVITKLRGAIPLPQCTVYCRSLITRACNRLPSMIT